MAWLMSAIGLGAREAEIYAQRQASEAQAVAYEYTARTNDADADAAEKKASFDAATSRDKLRKLLAKQRAAFAKSGVDFTDGSPLLVLADTAGEGKREEMAIVYEGNLQATRYRNQANLNRYYGAVTRKTGKLTAVAQMIGAHAAFGNNMMSSQGTSGGSSGYGYSGGSGGGSGGASGVS